MIIIARFGVPPLAQDKVLYIGIVVSMVLRAVCIAAGAAAIAAFSWVFYVFGAFLIYTAVRLVLSGENDADDVKEGAVLRQLRRVLPSTPAYDGGASEGRPPALNPHDRRDRRNRHRQPVVFALDSVPAIFGLTQDPYVVFTANAFALMGLRQLFFLIGGLLEHIIYLNIGLAAILGFIGVKPSSRRSRVHTSTTSDRWECRTSGSWSPSRSSSSRSRSPPPPAWPGPRVAHLRRTAERRRSGSARFALHRLHRDTGDVGEGSIPSRQRRHHGRPLSLPGAAGPFQGGRDLRRR